MNLMTIELFNLGFTFFAVFTSIFLIILFLLDKEEAGYVASVVTLIYVLINYWWGNLFNEITFEWIWLGWYLGIGLIYAIIRTYLFGRENRGKNERYYAIRDLKGNVFRWWFLFPVSLINWMLFDLASKVYNLIYSYIEYTMIKIFDLGAGKNKEEKEEEF